LAAARERLGTDERRTVLFLDEIHRFSKSQQDALLPGVEDGTVILIGATTENPFFEVNSPLMSRMTLFRTERLDDDAVAEFVDRALGDTERGWERPTDDLERRLERRWRPGPEATPVMPSPPSRSRRRSRSVGTPRRSRSTTSGEALQRRIVRYDKDGDAHYDVVSAFIKSVRGSDVDACPLLAPPDARRRRGSRVHRAPTARSWPPRTSARPIPTPSCRRWPPAQALAFVGIPEAAFHLTQATVYLAIAPKSNSLTAAMAAARALLEDGTAPVVPAHLRDAHYAGAEKLGHGEGTRTPTRVRTTSSPSATCPDGIDATLFRPGPKGREAALAERLRWIDEPARKAAALSLLPGRRADDDSVAGRDRRWSASTGPGPAVIVTDAHLARGMRRRDPADWALGDVIVVPIG
jgi:putative ATPase